MTTKEPVEKHDKKIAVIRDLVQQGMRLVIEGRKEMRELRPRRNAPMPVSKL